MRFNPRARLDTSQVSNRRGGGGGGMSRLPIPSGPGGKVGGGIGTLLLILVIVFLSGGLPGGGGTPSGNNATDQSFEACQSGEDANSDEDCARVAVVNSIQSFWTQALPQQTGRDYREAETVIFSGQTNSGCGAASSQVGPFYCPVDETAYLDTTFFDDMLEGQLGAKGGDFAEAYVIAHEYGHHVENILGLLSNSRGTGAKSEAVRIELMADCLAGAWTKHATTAEDANGEVFITDLDRADIAEALDAAAAVGDDRIQQRSGGRVDQESWTHGSAEQRMRWFTTGMEQGTVAACNTFDTDDL